MLLSEYYKESKYSANGQNYEVIESGKNQRSYFILKCNVCDDINTVTAASVLAGRKPCFCSRQGIKTPEKFKIRVFEVADKKEILVLTDYISNAKEKFDCRCLVCNHQWKTSYDGLVLKNRNCPKCAGTLKITEDILLSRIHDKLENKPAKLLDFQFNSNSWDLSKVKLNCFTCLENWETSACSIVGDSLCPKCAKYGFQKSIPACLYILKIIQNKEFLIGYKFGITSDLKRRLLQHNKSNKIFGISFEVSYVWNYNFGKDAVSHEKILKKTFKPFYDKNEVPFGFTETISIHDLSDLIELQSLQYKELING